MMPAVEEQIREHIAQNILFKKDGYPYPDEASFLEEGIVDSLNVMDLVFFIEAKFAISIADREVVPDNFDSVSKLAAFIRRKQAGA
jgi:acyl carrier protein